MSNIEDLLSFIQTSPTAFHAVQSAQERLEDSGFQRLFENECWSLLPGGRYYTVKNSSSLIAFIIPENTVWKGFHIIATHSDSPCFKLKELPFFKTDVYTKINSEKYGGPILSTWLDRPLSIAGRLLYKKENRLESTLVDMKNTTCLIPSVAPHLLDQEQKRQLHIDYSTILTQVDMSAPAFLEGETSIAADSILSHDLFLYHKEQGIIWGTNGEFYSAPRIDDLACVYTSLKAIQAAKPLEKASVFSVFDNEEVGSTGKQGALSTFLETVLEKIYLSSGRNREQYVSELSESFLLSADNGHAVHPNHPELSDSSNRVYLNRGIVIKRNASQKYTTDAVSSSFVQLLCQEKDIPFQHYANRSDMPGGSTLGNLLNTKISINSADIGLAQLAMHSAYETAGSHDIAEMSRFMEHFYHSSFKSPI